MIVPQINNCIVHASIVWREARGEVKVSAYFMDIDFTMESAAMI